MQELNFADSTTRLGWAESLVKQLTADIAALDRSFADEPFTYEIRDSPSDPNFEHVLFVSPAAPPVPDEIGLKVADVSTNLRSALDMALVNVLDHYGVEAFNATFPIWDDVKDPSKRVLAWMKSLPKAFQMAITSLQPSYDVGLGHFDVPINVTALMLREVSNANKHRLITPITWTKSEGLEWPSDTPLQDISDDEQSAWPDKERSILELKFRTPAVIDGLFDEIRPVAIWKLELSKSNFSYQELPFPLSISLGTFLTEAPRYVAHVLNALSRAKKHADEER